MGLADEDIHDLAKDHKWERFVIVPDESKTARRTALVFVRGTREEEVEFHIVVGPPDKFGSRMERFWQANKRPDEESVRYIRALDIGEPRGQHLVVRIGASFDEGEMFRCIKCAYQISGRFCDNGYKLDQPSIRPGHFEDTVKWRDYWRKCDDS